MFRKIKIASSLALAIFANTTIVFSQNIFQQRSGLTDIEFIGFSSIYPSDTGFFVIGGGKPIIAPDSIAPLRLFFLWYNWQGQIVKNKEFSLPKTAVYSMYYSSAAMFNSGFYHYAGIADTSNTLLQNSSDILIKKFNWNGDSVWTKKYDSGTTDLAYACAAIENGGIGVGSSYTNNNSDMQQRVIRFDSLGNIIWNKIYNTTDKSFAHYVLPDNAGNYFIGGWSRPFGGGNPKNARTKILKIDSNGDIIWNKSIPGICDEISSSLAIATDGNLLVAKARCINEPVQGAVDNKLALWKIDKNNGDTIWHREYEPEILSLNDSYFVNQLSDGNIIMGGIAVKLFIEDGDTLFGKQTGIFIKTDNEGNELWTRYYFYNEPDAANMLENYLTDGKQTPDGGFILVGRTVHQTTFDDGWIIKTDANGCIDLSCVNGVEELDDDDFRLSIYPNPAEEYVSVDLPIMYNSGIFQVYNLQGQLVKSAAITTGGMQSFNISDMPNGIYQLVVYTNTNKLLGREKLVVAR